MEVSTVRQNPPNFNVFRIPLVSSGLKGGDLLYYFFQGVLEDGNSDLNDWDVDSMGVNGSHLLKDTGQYGGEFNNRKVCTQNYLDAWVKDNSDKEWKDFKANYTAMNYPTAISGDQT